MLIMSVIEDKSWGKISQSYLGYWAYRIYIGERSDRYGYIYIYLFIFPRVGAGDYR